MNDKKSADQSRNIPEYRKQSPAEQLRRIPENIESTEEVDLWAGGYSGKAMYGTWGIMALLTIASVLVILTVASLRENKWVWIGVLGALAALWIFSFLKMVVRKMSVWYELTDQRFKHRAGFLTRMTDRIELIDIDDVTYRQGPVQAMLGVGTIFIKSSDSTHPELILNGVSSVSEVADRIDDARRKERRNRGLHIESV